MAAISGTAGSVTLAGTLVAEIAEWSLDLSMSPVDVTAFGDNWAKYVASIRNATGSFSGNHDGASVQQTALRNAMLGGSAVAFALHVNGTSEYNVGTAFLTGVTPSVSQTGAAAMSFNFQVSGPVTYS